MGNLCSNPNEPERGGFSTWPLEQNAYSAPKWTPSGNMIVFQHKDAIYTVNRQGTKLKRITSGDENDYELHQAPEISPDGSLIVYSTTRHKVSRNSQWVRNFDIEAMDIDGSNRVRLTNSRYWDLRPTWSQDGQKVFFRRVSRNDDAVVGTFAVNADGTDEQHLTWMHHGLRQSHHNDHTALWVESDSKLIHAKTGIWPVEYEIKKETTFVEEGESFIATANLDLSDLAEHRRFPDVSFPNPDHPPFQRMAMEIPGSIAWSPDGEKLAYILTRYDREDVEALKKYRIQEGPEPETVRTLNILNLADSKETSMELTDPACRGWMDWSPNGELILMYSNAVCIADLRDGTVSQLITPSGQNWPARWLSSAAPRAAFSPDGTRVAIQTRCTEEGGTAHTHHCTSEQGKDDTLMFTIRPDGTEFTPIVRVDRGNGKLKPGQN